MNNISLILLSIFLFSCTQERRDSKKENVYTFIFSNNLFIEKTCVSESGAGMFDTGTDYEWTLIDTSGHHLKLGTTSRNDFFDLRLINDTLYSTYVNEERNLNDLSKIINNYTESKTIKYTLSKYGFKTIRENVTLLKNPIKELEKDMILIKGGGFNMGSEWFLSTQPIHYVELDDFYISKYEVTQELWVKIMN